VFDEALAHGLPIVSCAAGAVVDTVPKGAGLLVAPDDDRSFADALGELLQDGDRYRQCADAATKAGELLPDWADTAGTVGEVLDKIRTG
jgi:glycosyltransferase involved in cell wall biosynthesis